MVMYIGLYLIIICGMDTICICHLQAVVRTLNDTLSELSTAIPGMMMRSWQCIIIVCLVHRSHSIFNSVQFNSIQFKAFFSSHWGNHVTLRLAREEIKQEWTISYRSPSISIQFLYISISPAASPSGWLGSKHQLTLYLYVFSNRGHSADLVKVGDQSHQRSYI